MTAEAGPALAEAAEVGPYFAWVEWADGVGWRPFTDLNDAAVVAERVRVARATLVERLGLTPGEVPERVVASVLFLGMASRLVSPPLAAVAVAEVLPVPHRDRLWWQPVDSGLLPVAFEQMEAVDARDLTDDAPWTSPWLPEGYGQNYWPGA